MFIMASKIVPENDVQKTVMQFWKLVFKQHLQNFESLFLRTSIDSSRLPTLQQKTIRLTTGMELKFALN
jgi:hypothetical protein